MQKQLIGVGKYEIFFHLSLGHRRPQQILGEFNATLDNSAAWAQGSGQVTDDHSFWTIQLFTRNNVNTVRILAHPARLAALLLLFFGY